MTRKLKSIIAAALTTVMIFGVSACGEVTVDESNSSNASTEALSGTLTLTGSTSMADVATALAEAFMADNSGVTVTVGGNGSGEGPTAVTDGTAQIGMLSRDLKDEENPDTFSKYIIGYDGIAVIVNEEAGVDSLTSEEVAEIFTGEITNWSEVGGVDAEISCVGREAASGTRSAFEELMGIEDVAVYAEEQNSTGNVKQSVSSNPNAIGYVSLSSVDDTVVAVALDGVSPSEETVKSGEYSLQRPFVIISKLDTTDPLTLAFIDYVYSDAGQQIIADDGVVPNPEA